jgi:hypothetical protein
MIQIAVAGAICVITVWALYRFPLDVRAVVAQWLTDDHAARPPYLLGQSNENGWWYYFPVAVAMKTTLGFLLAAFASALLLARRALRERNWSDLAPFASALAILLVAMATQPNTGVRQVLPLYAFLAVSAGCGVAALWQHSIRMRVAIAFLLACEAIASARAHPDYLAYFNALAGRHPHRVLLDSNLDWGQDLLRLSRRARELGIDVLHLSYFGTADPTRHGLPPLREWPPHAVPGWFATSENHFAAPASPDTRWLREFEPVDRIGKSIRLYRVTSRELARKTLAGFEPLVVPLRLGTALGVGRRRWLTELELHNRGRTPVAVHDAAGGSRTIAPGDRLKWDAATRTPSLIYVRPEEAANVSGTVRVASEWRGEREPTNLEVPAARARAFVTTPLVFNVPAACDGCRRTLRVFDLGSGEALRVVARSGQRSWSSELLLAREGDEFAEPASGWIELQSAFTELSNGAATLTVMSSGNDQRLWGFVSTGTESVILPAGRR